LKVRYRQQQEFTTFEDPVLGGDPGKAPLLPRVLSPTESPSLRVQSQQTPKVPMIRKQYFPAAVNLSAS
jgi:hypothetical protein